MCFNVRTTFSIDKVVDKDFCIYVGTYGTVIAEAS